MFELNQFESDIAWNNSKTIVELNDNSVMSFSYKGKPLLEIVPISFGVISECSGITKKIRKHTSIDKLSVSMETKVTLPFGTEPTISRFYEFAFNHCKVTSDIDIRKGINAEKFSIDNLFIPGNWKKAGLLKESGGGKLEIEWQTLEEGKIFFESDKTFLSVVFENSDGLLLEIGTGNDLWRWNSASAAGIKSSFRIKKTDKGVTIDRDVFVWDMESPVPHRNWRFHWYFSWMEKDALQKKAQPSKILPFPEKDIIPEKGKTAAYDFSTVNLSDSSKVKHNGNSTKVQCMQASVTQNYMKKIIRSAIQKSDKYKISFCNIAPHVCDDPSHLERPGKDTLSHWDIVSILDYALWANRQIIKGESQLFITPDSENLKQLPSLSGLMN